MNSNRLLAGSVATWLTIVVVGFASLLHHKAQPGEEGSVPRHWPETKLLGRDGRHVTVLFFAHPRCPCTNASFHELQWIQSKSRSSADVQIIFCLPDNNPADWKNSNLVAQAQSMRDVSIRFDVGGKIAREFGVLTSGQALVYDKDGLLLFSGGITPMRGHEGDNPGRARLLAALLHRTAGSSSPAFGCPLMVEKVQP